MDKYITSIFLFIYIVNAATAMRLPTEDHYWREYNGNIPEDAFIAGFDAYFQPIYIGQVLVKDKLIPGTLHEGDDKIYYEFGEHAWSTNENVNIFCTQYPNNFEWVPTSRSKVPELTDILIKGGFQSNFKTYIGRKNVNGVTNVGKVICNEKNCLALYVNDNGSYQEYHKFEILTYSPISDNNIRM